MIAQYTQAALVSELKRLAVPASVDSIPSSAMQEDHVSMGWSAARKLRTAVDNLTRVIAVELYARPRAVEMREGLSAGAAPTQAVISAVREAGVEGPGPDRFLAPDLAARDVFVREGRWSRRWRRSPGRCGKGDGPRRTTTAGPGALLELAHLGVDHSERDG